MEIQYKTIHDLIPYARNARTHSDEQVSQIAASIKEFGFTNPILVDGDNGVIAGHGRLSAAIKLKMETVPTIELSGLSEAQKRAYILADNKLSLNAGWDTSMLSIELTDLKEMGADLSLVGFTEDELASYLEPDVVRGNTEDDAAPGIQDDPVSVIGDLWILGDHRLLCGDSTNIGDIDRLMNNNTADLIFTDPPYGMSYGGGRARGEDVKDKRTGGVKIKAHGEILGDNLRGDGLIEMVRDALSTANTVRKQGAASYVCFTWRTYTEFESALVSSGFDPKACIVWDKKSIGLGYSNYRPQHEFIFYCDGQWYGENNESDVWYLSRGNTGEYVHPTQKPVELIIRALHNSSKAGDVVLDSFGGSGATMIACEKTGRHARLMELDPRYVDVIIKRWQDFTGREAVRDDGVKYSELENGRS